MNALLAFEPALPSVETGSERISADPALLKAIPPETISYQRSGEIKAPLTSRPQNCTGK